MLKAYIPMLLCVGLFTSCTPTGSSELFNGEDTDHLILSGDVSLNEEILSLKGKDSKIISKGSNFKNFDMNLILRTTPKGKGFINFHTDDTNSKGYSIAINNDRKDPTWWRMTGSLVSVRNLTKSFIKEDEWFKMNIRVEGQAITVLINGDTVTQYIEPKEPYRIDPNTKALISVGKISIQNYGIGEIQIKSIDVRGLKAKDIDVESQFILAKDEQKDEIIRLHQEDFPVLDYHVHLKGGLTKEVAAKQSRETGINYAISPNCGVGFPITNDKEVMNFLEEMRSSPFILAMQAEGREWTKTFSPKVVKEFDYVFTDALTFTDHKKRRTRLWIPKETWIDNEQKYMDMIVDKIIEVLKEPVAIYVNPCFLPAPMDKRFDAMWTEARMNKFIDALAKSGKALEINELYQIPNKAIIMKAKAAGVKFTFGSNNITPDVSKLQYSIRMKKECGLTAKDMYKPKIKI